ncbi:ParB N-terminal domain-containing protein [Streptomyces sp. A3M-1-3]|uniref:ParB/RepB/Spo0J family partition protein n=1 Tax=Streptomyces sp. A3M-1-3 TaxID=2962044 RepID=UPI0020B7F8DC|nr:ParB N-terminal domain-containing protein [Streptomyces sp. A3M-1-3]MCP3822765.1 ParB N-terminal domain-containing protein [Streptomyces sp. A3M-1-3]
MSPDRRKTAAERTGPSAAFGFARAPRSTRGQIIDSVVGAPPASVSTDLVAENPENPRREFDEEYLDSLARNMREVGQIQTATVMTRLAFLVAHPEHKDTVPPDHEYVVIDGHCRLRAVRRAGIDLRITVDDSSAGTREDLLAAALSANHFRKDLTPIEEAEAIEALVTFHGSAAAVVTVLGGAVNDSWISTRRALLKLPEPIQQRVAVKEVPIAIARKAGTLPREEQTAFVEAKMAERKAHQDRKPKPVRGRAAAAVKKDDPQHSTATPAPTETLPSPESTPSAPTTTVQQSVPEPRVESPAPDGTDVPVDWTNPDAVTAIILQRCSPDAVQRIAQDLLDAL